MNQTTSHGPPLPRSHGPSSEERVHTAPVDSTATHGRGQFSYAANVRLQTGHKMF